MDFAIARRSDSAYELHQVDFSGLDGDRDKSGRWPVSGDVRVDAPRCKKGRLDVKRMRTALVGIGVVLVGEAVAVAPAAKADCAAETGSCYGAIAYSPSKGAAYSDVNNPTQEIADRDALAECNVQNPTTDCIVVGRGTQCLALAAVPVGQNEFYHIGYGPTKAVADADAITGHPGWTILVDACNS